MATYEDKIKEHSSLLGLWMLNEAEGLAAADELGNNNGLHVSSPSVDNGLIFDGGKSRNYSSGASTCRTELPSGVGEPLCVELWFRHDAAQSYSQLIGRYVGNTNRWSVFKTPSAFPVLAISSAQIIAADSNLEADGLIHHLVVRHNDGITDMWIDGVQQSTSTPSNPFASAVGAVYDIGNYKYDNFYDNPLNGAIDAIAIYDAPLTDAEIADHYDWGINGVPQPTGSAPITGTILLDGAPVDAAVLLMRDSDRLVVSETMSDELTGDYSFGITGETLEEVPYYVICLYGEGIRPLIHGPVIPEISGIPVVDQTTIPHRYWRLVIHEQNVNAKEHIAIGDFELIGSGGTDQTTPGGSITATTEANTSNSAGMAIDGDLTSKWTSSPYPALPQILQYDFGVGSEAAVQTLTLSASTYSGQEYYAPKIFDLEYSDDGAAWHKAVSRTSEIGWSPGEKRTYPCDFPA